MRRQIGRPAAAVKFLRQAGIRIGGGIAAGISGSGPNSLAPMVPRRQPSSTNAQTPTAKATDTEDTGDDGGILHRHAQHGGGRDENAGDA